QEVDEDRRPGQDTIEVRDAEAVGARRPRDPDDIDAEWTKALRQGRADRSEPEDHHAQTGQLLGLVLDPRPLGLGIARPDQSPLHGEDGAPATLRKAPSLGRPRAR